MVCHAMLLAIQASIDIATAMAVMKTPRRPDTYRETFHVLGNFGILPEDLSNEMARLAGFRNNLVHDYSGLDTKQVFKVLLDEGKTLETFRNSVKEFLREHKKTP